MIFLASTLHNPNSEMLPVAKKYLGKLKRLFINLNVVATTTTDKGLIDYLLSKGVKMKLVRPVVLRGSSNHRKEAIRMALNKISRSTNFIFHIDFDRLLHWINYHPKELESLVKNPPNFDLISVGRTPRAFKTHPKVQQKWEKWTNKKLYKIVPIRLDMPSGCQILSYRMAKLIANKADENLSLSEAEGNWLGLAYKNRLKIGLVEKEGLEFETADFHQTETKKLGSLEKWIETNYETRSVWKLRQSIAEKTVAAAKKLAQALPN